MILLIVIMIVMIILTVIMTIIVIIRDFEDMVFTLLLIIRDSSMTFWFTNMCVFVSLNWGPLTLSFMQYP